MPEVKIEPNNSGLVQHFVVRMMLPRYNCSHISEILFKTLKSTCLIQVAI